MKHFVKMFAAGLLSLLMILAAAACGSQSVTDEPTVTDNAAVTEPAATETPVAAATDALPADDDVDGELIFDHQEELQYANQFTIAHYKGGYTMFTVASAEDKQFLIVPEGKSVPAELPDNTVVLQQPIDKICICSTGMVSLVDAIGGLDHIATVGTDTDGWYLDNVIAKMQAGEIKYSGKYKEPDFEMLINEGVQLEIDTTMLNNCPDVMAKYDELNIPYFVESSSYENYPLGRVEWVKLFGAIMGLEDEAQAYFDAQVAKVNAVISNEKCGKTVAMFYISKDIVYARNGGDYMAAMIGLAGGDYIMADVDPDKSGTAKINFEEFYSRCKDADYIFYVLFTSPFDSIDGMIEYNELFSDFKAVQDGNVYVTAPSFGQSIASIADIITDMHTVLNDPTVEETGSLIKLH